MATDGCWQVKRKPPARVLSDGGRCWQAEGWLANKETPPFAFCATEGVLAGRGGGW